MSFEKLTKPYRSLVLSWLAKLHVAEFYYGDGLKNTMQNIELYCDGINDNGSYTFEHWLAFLNAKPYGFLMTTPVTGPYDDTDDYNKYYADGKKIYTLDVLIGEETYLGKGLAPEMISSFIRSHYSHANYFLIDPSVINPKAIHVYEKVGFRKIGEFYPSFDPTVKHLMMRLDLPVIVN